MQQSAELNPNEAPGGDIYFQCDHCAAPLVVDRAAADLTLNCQHCGKPTHVPSANAGNATGSTSAASEPIADLQRRITENESQRTEITSYINQLNIQVHRWQLRLQQLNKRRAELQAELARLSPPE